MSQPNRTTAVTTPDGRRPGIRPRSNSTGTGKVKQTKKESNKKNSKIPPLKVDPEPETSPLKDALHDQSALLDITSGTPSLFASREGILKKYDPFCVCQVYISESISIQCDMCNDHWHLKCAKLEGLTQSMVEQLKQWHCPNCIKSPFPKPSVSSSVLDPAMAELSKTIETIRKCNKELKNGLSDLTKKIAELQEELAVAQQPAPPAPLVAQSEDDPFLRSINERLDAIMKDQADLKLSFNNPPPRSPSSTSPPASPHVENRRAQTRPRIVLTTNPTNHVEEKRAGYIDQKLSLQLLEFLDSSNAQLTKKNGRSVGAYGEPYKYPGSGQAKKTPLPPCVKSVVDKVNLEFPGANINSCVVNKYTGPSSSLPEHSDDESCLAPGSSIYTVSLGSAASITYRDLITKGEKSEQIENRSLYVMSQNSQFYWTHRIDQHQAPADGAEYMRISITLRSVSINNIHSTVLLGDSNTKYMYFEGDTTNNPSATRSTFGPKMPGKRVPTFHISQIDPLKCIGYQNIILHVGINDFNPRSKGRTETDPDVNDVRAIFENFVAKVENILTYCPYSKLIVSPILPTKIESYNRKAKQFNEMLFKYADRNNLIKTLDFNCFLDFSLRYLENSFGSYLNPSDPIHLGRMGVQKLSSIFRSAIFRNMVDGRSYSGMVTNHAYKRDYPPIAS